MNLFEEIYPHLREPEGPDTKGNYLAWCPFHADGQGKPPHRKNLSVHPEKGFYCFACSEKGDLRRLAKELGVSPSAFSDKASAGQTIYRYEDEQGKLLFETVRYYGRDGKKSFYQRRPDGCGGFVNNLKGVRRVLYRLPELLKRPTETIYVVEGEKDADRLNGIRLLSTTNPCGAGKWRKEYTEALKGRDVVLMGDNDEPGRNHVERVERSLRGLARSVKVVQLPDLPVGGDVSDWLDRGGTPEKLAALVAEAQAAGGDDAAPADEFLILDSAPESISRPLALVGGRGYASTWVYDKNGRQALIIVRDDGALYSAAKIPGAIPLEKLGVLHQIKNLVPDSRAWSGAGVKRYVGGERPKLVEVFERLVAVIDHFMDFDRSLAPQRTMCELVALFILATYFLDAFFVIGYLWPNGEWGCGKTRLLEVIVEAAYIGCLILNSSTLPTLRDLADYGATLAFDDAEGIMDTKRADPDKRAFLLAGNRKGSTISIKEQVDQEWKTRHYRTFCPRLFSAIRLPDEVLGSRTITIPLVKSGEKQKTDRNPLDHASWPHDRQRLVDDLWALGLANLASMRSHDAIAVKKSGLCGRALEPWRAILAVAHCLQVGHGCKELFDRMEALSRTYQTERAAIEDPSLVRVAVQALAAMAKKEAKEEWAFATKDLTDRINELAIELELPPDDSTNAVEKKYTSSNRVGLLLKKLRFERPDSRDSAKRQWKARRAQIAKLCKTHGIPVPWETDTQGPPRQTPPTGNPPSTPGPSGNRASAEGLGGDQGPVTPATLVTSVTDEMPSKVPGLTGVTGLAGLTGGSGPPIVDVQPGGPVSSSLGNGGTQPTSGTGGPPPSSQTAAATDGSWEVIEL